MNVGGMFFISAFSPAYTHFFFNFTVVLEYILLRMGFPRLLLICGLVYSAHAGIFKDAQKFGEDFIKVINELFRGGGGGAQGLEGLSINL